jgi:hypothetical protein
MMLTRAEIEERLTLIAGGHVDAGTMEQEALETARQLWDWLDQLIDESKECIIGLQRRLYDAEKKLTTTLRI